MADDDDSNVDTQDFPEGWSSNSNECFHITLVRADGQQHAAFQPAFTYPIFGEQEAIFGYNGLSIELTFAAHNLEPRLQVSYDAEYEATGDIEATNVAALLADFLPADAFKGTRLAFENAKTFRPPGEVVRAYTRDGQRYEIRCASLVDHNAKELLERMQILIPMFIEGGTMLQLEQDWTTQRWKLFTAWSIEPSQTASDYSLIGYSTSYRIFSMQKRRASAMNSTHSQDRCAEPDFLEAQHSNGVTTPLELPSRERLSQFLILPDFQNSGHGQELYRAMYKHLTGPSNVQEFTVEDPNESFDDLRDLCDLTFLRARYPEFAALEINTNIPSGALASDQTVPIDLIVPKEKRDKIRQEAKIETRQFNRLVEAHILSKIPSGNRSKARITRRDKTTNKHDKQYYFWRLYVKQRLMIFNEDALKQLDREERIEKLEGAVDSNQEYFVGLIERVQKREAQGIDIDGDALASTNGSSKGKKRKIIADDDDDDDEEDIMSNASKRSRAT